MTIRAGIEPEIMQGDLLVAVYGTLRQGFGNHVLLEGAAFVGQGVTVPEFTMLSAGFPVCLQGDTGAPKVPIHVEVYNLSAAQHPERILRRLDTLEGHPDWYQRQPVQCCIVMEGDQERTVQVTAWMYIMPGDIEDFPQWKHVPSGDYKQHRDAIRRGA